MILKKDLQINGTTYKAGEDIDIMTIMLEVTRENADTPKANSYKRWRATKGETYNTIGNCGTLQLTKFNDQEDDYTYATGNYFKTDERAEAYMEYLLAVTKINDEIREMNEGWIPDWSNTGEEKYHILYDHNHQVYVVDHNRYFSTLLVLIYCQTKYIAEYIIDSFQDELNIITSFCQNRQKV